MMTWEVVITAWQLRISARLRYLHSHNSVQATSCNTHHTPKKPGTNQLPRSVHCRTRPRHSNSTTDDAPIAREINPTPSGVNSCKVNNRMNFIALRPPENPSADFRSTRSGGPAMAGRGRDMASNTLRPSPNTTACGKLIMATAVTMAPPKMWQADDVASTTASRSSLLVRITFPIYTESV